VNDEAVFAKTGRGQREIEKRSHGLDARHRTLLIMLDGRRPVSELRQMLGNGENLAPMLLHLVELGLIGSARPVTMAPKATPRST
jgi:hypothetical protein